MSHRSLLSAIALLACVAACAKQDRSSTTTDSTATPATASTPTINTVTVTARDFAFEAPAQIPAGVTTLHLVNQGKELHHVQVLKFEQGKTLNDFIAALKGGGAMPAWAIDIGGPNAPVPGGESSATVTIDPGSYAFVCFVDTPDHVPHLMKGMARPFTVTPATTTVAVAEPVADVTVTLADYSFALSTPLTHGKHTIRVENTAAQPHEIELVQLDSGKTMDDLVKWAASYKGPPPARPIGGMTGLAGGRHGFFTVDLQPGEYGLICFYPDMKDGKPHFAHGMRQQIKIS